MKIFSEIDSDPGTFESLTLDARELYNEMVEAHYRAAEVYAHHLAQFGLWHEAGRPLEKFNGVARAKGHEVLPPLQSRDLSNYLEDQMARIKFLGMSHNEYVQLSMDDFKRYTLPLYSFSQKE